MAFEVQNNGGNKVFDQSNFMDLAGDIENEQNYNIEELESKDDEDTDEEESLPSGSYDIIQLGNEEIFASHSNFYTILRLPS